MQVVRVWDLPVRLFHWLLVLSILGSFISANLGGNWMEWHQKIGFFVLGLILFRVAWGFAGNHYARFSTFVRKPSVVIAYAKSLLKPESKSFASHNPMGALSVVALLACLALQAVTGLFSNDDITVEGPYANMVSKAVSDQMTSLHKLNSDLLMVLMVLHLAAIIFYTVYKKEKLIKAMITGDKVKNSGIDGQFEVKMAESPRPIWLSWFLIAVVSGMTYVIVTRAFW